MMFDGLPRSSDLDIVVCLQVTLNNDNGAYNRLRLLLAFIAVMRKDWDIQNVPFMGIPRNRGGDFTSVLVNADGPRLAVLAGKGGLVRAVLEGVARRGFIGRVAAQPALREFRSEADIRIWLTSYSVVSRDLDFHDGLELNLNLIGSVIRVGCLHLRGDDGSRRDRVVCLCGDLTGVIDLDGPAIRDSGLINLELRRGDWLMALHDGLSGDLRGDVFIHLALGKARAHEIGDLGVVRVDHDEQLKFIGRAIRVLHDDLRASKGARLRVFRSGDGDVVVIVHLDGPALVDVLLVQLDLGLEAAVTLLLHQVLDLIWYLFEDDLLWLGSQRADWAVNTRDYRRVRLVVFRRVVLGIVQGEGLGVDDVCLVVARQRVGAVEGSIMIPEEVLVALSCSLELVHGTRLRQNGEDHVLVSCQVGAAVLRPREVDVASGFVGTQVLRTAGCCRVRGADELAVAVVGLHDHAGHGVIRAAARHCRNVNLTDLGFLTRDDNVLLEVLPRHRDRVTFDVLARPRVHDGCKG